MSSGSLRLLTAVLMVSVLSWDVSASLFDFRTGNALSLSTIHWGSIFKGLSGPQEIPLDVKKSGVGVRFVPQFDESLKGDAYKAHRQVILVRDEISAISCTEMMRDKPTFAEFHQIIRL
jgi:hypothetical protein